MDQTGLTSRDIIGMFYEILEKTAMQSWVPRVSMLFPSNQETENYKWLGMSPALAQWVGRRRPTSLKVDGVSLTNVPYDATLEIALDDIRRAKTQQIRVRIAELGVRAINHWASLITTLIQNGESTNCYDGQYFFDDDHPIGNTGSTQSNDLSASDYGALNVATSTAPTAYELSKIILALIQHLFSLKDDQNEPINENARQFGVMVPTSFMGNTIAALANKVLDTGSGGVDNPIQGALKQDGWEIVPMINPRLTWTTKIAVFRLDGAAKPLIRQFEDLTVPGNTVMQPTGIDTLDEARGIKLSAIAEDTEEEKKNKRHLYMVDASRTVGYGYYEHAVLGTLS